LIELCEHVSEKKREIHAFYREWREKVGDEGAIVIGHPLIPWLTGQVSQQDMVYVAADFPETYHACMEAILKAALMVFEMAMQEGVDFMSEGGYGLEMVSPRWYETYDLQYIQRLSGWTHEHRGLFWQHNCGRTRELIKRGFLTALEQMSLKRYHPHLKATTIWLKPGDCSILPSAPKATLA